MPARAQKQRIPAGLVDLPDDAAIDDAIERRGFRAKVEKGLAQLGAGQGCDHDEVRRRLAR